MTKGIVYWTTGVATMLLSNSHILIFAGPPLWVFWGIPYMLVEANVYQMIALQAPFVVLLLTTLLAYRSYRGVRKVR